MSETRLIRSGHSPAFLAEHGTPRRLPRAARKARPPGFFERFEDRALVYDCFRHADGARILMVGPPPMNLMPQFRAARFVALPSRTPLRAAYHPSLSTMITELTGAPAGTPAVAMSLAGEEFVLPVQPNHSADLAGRRVLFTMSKDNELGWIAEWARWHAALHGTDAIVLFDNGSTRYGVEEIEQTLLGVEGIGKVVVRSWPYRYGMTDPALFKDPFYILFLQVSSMSVALRRYAARAYGLLNCDVDELASTPPGTTIFDLAKTSSQGLVVMRGRYMEPVADADAPAAGRTHRHFLRSFRDSKRAASRPKKWALDPRRSWVGSLDVHPYMHWIKGRPWFSKSTPEGIYYRHFRGINTNWKDSRTEAGDLRAEDLMEDADFRALVARNAF
ncbi:MAG: hypothetical protein Q8L54_06285 [Devosia sp.]|nr:hypothetical protein [Devosia sp.]